ncbi:MAG: ferrochelatase [Caulobacteraceae bacterium]
MSASGNKPRLAVVLFNLGGPDGPKAVRPFLFNLFSDPAIITLPAVARLPLAALISTTRAKSARANYARMGGASPLLPETTAQAGVLEAALKPVCPEFEVRVFIAMRYWTPTTEEAAAEVKAWAPDEIVLLPLYPQYSTTTTESSLKAWRGAYKGRGKVRAVCCYPLDEGLVDAHAQRIRAAWNAAGAPLGVRLLFSAHGLPENIVKGGDPYQAQVEATAKAVAERLVGAHGWPSLDWTVCYQSRVGRLKWIGPSTTEAIAEAAAEGKGVVVCPISFVSEHIETLVELDHDYAVFAAENNAQPYIRVPALGVHGHFIQGLAAAVKSTLDRAEAGQGDIEPGSAWRCSRAFGRCPCLERVA